MHNNAAAWKDIRFDTRMSGQQSPAASGRDAEVPRRHCSDGPQSKLRRPGWKTSLSLTPWLGAREEWLCPSNGITSHGRLMLCCSDTLESGTAMRRRCRAGPYCGLAWLVHPLVCMNVQDLELQEPSTEIQYLSEVKRAKAGADVHRLALTCRSAAVHVRQPQHPPVM